MQARRIRGGRLLAAILVATWSLAAHSQAIRDEARRLLDEERQRQREEMLDKPAPAIAGQPAADADLAVVPQALVESGPTFLITDIAIEGDTLLGEDLQRQIAAPFVGQELGQRRIDLLLRRLTAAYLERGYATTRAYLPPQNLASGRLTVTIIPGTIERIEVDGSAAGGPSASAFPAGAGDTLRLSDLEQAVDQINRLRSRQAEARIQPGQTPGTSTIAIDSHAERPWRLVLGADNYGQRTTGDQRQRVGVEVDNLLGAWDAWSFQQVYSAHSQTSLFAFSVPAGYGTFSYSWADSASRVMVTDTVASRTQAQSHTLGWNHVIARDQTSRWAIDATLAQRAAQRRLDDIVLAPQHNATGRLAVGALFRGEKGAATIDFGYARGLNAFGADGDIPGLPRSAPHNEFEKWDVAVSGSWALTPDLLWRGNLVGQTSRTGLPGHEQLFLGGSGTVRGFREGVLSGDKGAFTRQELHLPRLLGQEPVAAGWHFAPFAFLDASSSRLASDTGYRQLVSAGLGLRGGWKGATADIAWGKPLAAPTGIDRSGWLHAAITILF